MRFAAIALVASLGGGLAQYRPAFGVGLVDALLDGVRWGLDNPAAGARRRAAPPRLAPLRQAPPRPAPPTFQR